MGHYLGSAGYLDRISDYAVVGRRSEVLWEMTRDFELSRSEHAELDAHDTLSWDNEGFDYVLSITYCNCGVPNSHYECYRECKI